MLSETGFVGNAPDPSTPRKALRRAIESWVLGRSRSGQEPALSDATPVMKGKVKRREKKGEKDKRRPRLERRSSSRRHREGRGRRRPSQLSLGCELLYYWHFGDIRGIGESICQGTTGAVAKDKAEHATQSLTRQQIGYPQHAGPSRFIAGIKFSSACPSSYASDAPLPTAQYDP